MSIALRPVAGAGLGGGAQHGQLAQRLVANSAARGERSGRSVASSACSSVDAPRFVQGRVVVAGAGGLQQLGDHPLVHVGVLPHVERGQVEAEAVDRADQVRQPALAEGLAVMGDQRVLDDLQVGLQLVGRGVGRRRRCGDGRTGGAPVSAGAAAASRA